MTELRYYPHDYTDEVVPCDCTLAGWAAWFAAPDHDWGRPEAAQDGETFKTIVAEIREIVCTLTEDGWRHDGDPAAKPGNTTYFLRHSPGGGWWADNSGETIEQAIEFADNEGVGDVAHIAAMDFTGEVLLRFSLTPDGPAMIVEAVQ